MHLHYYFIIIIFIEVNYIFNSKYFKFFFTEWGHIKPFNTNVLTAEGHKANIIGIKQCNNRLIHGLVFTIY